MPFHRITASRSEQVQRLQKMLFFLGDLTAEVLEIPSQVDSGRPLLRRLPEGSASQRQPLLGVRSASARQQPPRPPAGASSARLHPPQPALSAPPPRKPRASGALVGLAQSPRRRRRLEPPLPPSGPRPRSAPQAPPSGPPPRQPLAPQGPLGRRHPLLPFHLGRRPPPAGASSGRRPRRAYSAPHRQRPAPPRSVRTARVFKPSRARSCNRKIT